MISRLQLLLLLKPLTDKLLTPASLKWCCLTVRDVKHCSLTHSLTQSLTVRRRNSFQFYRKSLQEKITLRSSWLNSTSTHDDVGLHNVIMSNLGFTFFVFAMNHPYTSHRWSCRFTGKNWKTAILVNESADLRISYDSRGKLLPVTNDSNYHTSHVVI